MNQHAPNDRHAMKGNVQGFELPRGCLMTSGVILLPILTFTFELTHVGSVTDLIFAVALTGLAICPLLLMRSVSAVGRG